MTVLAATAWPTNADMIVDIVELGYIKPTDRIIDLTFGRGVWWRKYRHPGDLWANVGPHNGEPLVSSNDITVVTYEDYTNLPEPWGNQFDVVVFDPPYISMGGRSTSTIPDFVDRFGLAYAANTPAGLHAWNAQGLAEAVRICKPGGFVMTKCADYISSGQLQLASHWMLQTGLNFGLRVHDKLTHVGHARAQPATTTCRHCDGMGGDPATGQTCDVCGGAGNVLRKVVHARQNTSTLWVFQRPPERKRKA